MARHNKKRGLSGKEAAAAFNVSPQTFCEWEKKGWVVRFPDKSVDESATRIRIDTYRDPFVGGKSDRGVEPKPLLARAGADGQAQARAGAPGRGRIGHLRPVNAVHDKTILPTPGGARNGQLGALLWQLLQSALKGDCAGCWPAHIFQGLHRPDCYRFCYRVSA